MVLPSLAKSTCAEKRLMSPEASASAWARSRHQVPSTAAPAAASAIVAPTSALLTSGIGSSKRKATLKSAAPLAAAPPGESPDAVGAGAM